MFRLWGFAVAAAYVPDIASAPYMPRFWAIALGLGFVPRFDLRLIDEKILWCMGIVLLWSGLTLMWTPALYGGALLVAFMALFCLVAVASAAATSVERASCLEGFATGMLISAGLAIAQTFFGYAAIPQSAVPGGLFFNPEVLAETAAPIAIWCAVKSPWHRVAAMILGAVVIMAGERIAIAVLAIGLIYGLVTNRSLRSALLLGVAIAGFAALFWKISSADARILYWQTAALSVTFFGRGVGWWFQAHPFPHEEYVHSDVLQSFVEIGALGALPFMAIFAIAWRGGGTRAERAAFLAVVLECLVSFPLHLPATLFLAALFTGILACRRADVCGAGLSGREDLVGDPGQPAACGGGLSYWRGFRRRLVSIRSAHPQHENLYPSLSGEDRGRGTIQCQA